MIVWFLIYIMSQFFKSLFGLNATTIFARANSIILFTIQLIFLTSALRGERPIISVSSTN